MKTIILALTCLFSACVFASPEKEATDQAKAFYSSYLTSFTSDTSDSYPPSLLKKYVAANTIKRIKEVRQIPDQDLLESDYFTYCQDYDPSWIPILKVDNAKPTTDGDEVVQVWLGVEDSKKLHLEVFMTLEDNSWKIYRVRNVSNNFEHHIFNNAVTLSTHPKS